MHLSPHLHAIHVCVGCLSFLHNSANNGGQGTYDVLYLHTPSFSVFGLSLSRFGPSSGLLGVGPSWSFVLSHCAGPPSTFFHMNRCSQRRTTLARDRGRPLGLATATGLSAGRQLPSQPPLSRASGKRRSVHEADVFQQPQFGLAPQGFATPVLHGAPVNRSMLTVTGVDMDRNDNPDVLTTTAVWSCASGFCYSCPIWSSSEHRHHDYDSC